MTNKKIGLVWYCRTEQGWRRFPVVMGGNNRIKKGIVIVDGEEKHYPDGRFQIRRYENRKVIYRNIEGDPATMTAGDAVAARDKEAHFVTAKDSAGAAGVKLIEEPSRVNLRKYALKFEQDAIARNALEAAEVNRNVTAEFLAETGLTFADEVRREHVLAFHKALRQRGCQDRTVFNKHARLRSFLHFCGIPKEVLPPAPKYDAKIPTVYSKDDNANILAAAGAGSYMHLAISLGLKCGLREQELMHLEWGDIFFEDAVLRVTSKLEWGFKIKDSEERELPVPTDLLKELRKWRKSYPTTRLILPSKTGRPNGKLLRQLKRLAKTSGLNCNGCAGCKTPLQECQQWQLHKLRRSYCTTLMRSGVDTRTIQRLMGHSDLESTLRYLSPASTKEVQGKINKIKWV